MYSELAVCMYCLCVYVCGCACALKSSVQDYDCNKIYTNMLGGPCVLSLYRLTFQNHCVFWIESDSNTYDDDYFGFAKDIQVCLLLAAASKTYISVYVAVSTITLFQEFKGFETTAI